MTTATETGPASFSEKGSVARRRRLLRKRTWGARIPWKRTKVDESNRPDFEKASMQPFRPYLDRPTVMQYYEVPVDVLEDRKQLAAWARKAIAVARRARGDP